jgi:hypothetical protein
MLALVWLILIGIGMVIGFARIITGRFPLIMAGLVIIIGVLIVAWASIWAWACPQCRVGWEDTRESMWGGYVALVGLVVAPVLVGIAAGALAAAPIVHWRRNRPQSSRP